MCRGHIVESAPRQELFANAVHPYTKALLAAVPSPDLNHPLDFQGVSDARLATPDKWEQPFRIPSPQNCLSMVEVAPNHYVRASKELMT